MRVRDEFVRSVGFVSRGGEQQDYRGTAFFVIMQVNDLTFHYILTAAHVARHLEGYGCIIGFNGLDGTPCGLDVGGEQWFYHPTDPLNTDVAVMPFVVPAQHNFNITGIPISMFVSDVSISIEGTGVGDEVSMVGLFTKFIGTTHFHPIVRTGNIAMMPRDRILLTDSQSAEVYLIESRSVGGLSGSPVFWRQSISMPGVDPKTGEAASISGLGKIGLLGLIQGHWDLPGNLLEAERKELVNMGISIVVPAKKLLETLNHPDLVLMRSSATV